MLPGHVLRSIVALHDLPHLVAALGHEPLWEPIDAGTLDLGRRSDPPMEAAIVGRLGGFTWYALASSDPARSAPRIARRLAERGRVCGVFGLDQARRQLAVSVAFDGTPTLEVDLDRPSQLAASCLARIGAAEAGGSLGIAARTAEALSGAGLGRQFFASFRSTLDRFISALPTGMTERDRHELALLQLTRVLFLYFVQAKGWLDGADHFLRGHIDDCLFHRKGIHRRLLLPLFFGTLNQPAPRRRGAARAFGRIPFLNGGLFEPHRLERRFRPVIPDATWRDAFDTLFERYHFTLNEAASGGIAPDMLGRVFEGVMDPVARKRSGTYYTPRALVQSVVGAALAGFVGGKLGCSDAAALARLDAGDESAVRLLDDITILDPAVGSGAFLLGALQRLVVCRTAAGRMATPRRIVSRNLYGVDLNPAAIRLAELRLWLAVISAEPDGAPDRVEPLPNLDGFVRQGDSLTDPLRLMLRHPLRASRHAHALGAARYAAAAASGVAKRDALHLLRRLELDTASERLDAAVVEREADIRTLLSSGREKTLFGDSRGLDPRLRKALRLARRELSSLRSVRRRLLESGEAPAFDFDTHFGDVMARGGFDVVVGNPPWVRAESLTASMRTQLRERFRWWRAGRERGYGHQPDLAVAFLERGWELTAPGGVLAMLVPAKIATAAYGAVVRSALTESGTLLALADLTHHPEANFDATTYPLVIVVRSHPPPETHRPMLGLDAATRTPLEPPAGPGAPWVLLSGNLHRAMTHLRRHRSLSDALRIQLGVKTGANHLFLAPSPEIESELVRPALHGRDIRAFRATPSGQIIWTHDSRGIVLPSLPAGAARHFARHIEALRGRSDDVGGQPWSLFRASAGGATPRVVWSDLAPRLEAACLVGPAASNFVPLNTCYLVRCASPELALALCAWLNSTYIRAVARAAADPANGGFARFNARAVGAVPLPPGALDTPRLVVLAHRGLAGEAVQDELDDYVGDSLDLGPEERRILAEVVGVGAPRRR